MVGHIFQPNSRRLYLEFFSCCFSPLHQNDMWQLPKYDRTHFALMNSMWPFDTQLIHGIHLCENVNLCITFPLEGNASESKGTVVRLYEWLVRGWVVYVCVCAYISICDRPLLFSLDECEYHTPTLFPHTLMEHQNIFLRTWIVAEHYKWTSKMPANYYGVPLLNLSILSPGCQTDCLRCSEQPALWNSFH